MKTAQKYLLSGLVDYGGCFGFWCENEVYPAYPWHHFTGHCHFLLVNFFLHFGSPQVLCFALQVFRCEAARLIHISDFGNGTRVTQFEVYPGIGGLVEVTGGPDIGIGGPGAGQATMPTSTTLGPGSTPRPTITPPTTRRPGEVGNLTEQNYRLLKGFVNFILW